MAVIFLKGIVHYIRGDPTETQALTLTDTRQLLNMKNDSAMLPSLQLNLLHPAHCYSRRIYQTYLETTVITVIIINLLENNNLCSYFDLLVNQTSVI